MEIFDFILHIDKYLADAIDFFGNWTYIIIFAIIFAETGLVVIPFLPGDSLLFAVGTLAGGGLLNISISYFALLIAAILGDTVNYWIGHYIGPKVFHKENSRFFNKEYLEKTREFYAKYGGKTIIIARFLPIIRTFAPFVAGVGKMNYATFFFYNVFGGFIWVTSLVFAGFYLGGLPFIKANFEYAIFAIIALSLLPMLIEYIKYERGPKISKKQMGHANYKDVKGTFKKENLIEFKIANRLQKISFPWIIKIILAIFFITMGLIFSFTPILPGLPFLIIGIILLVPGKKIIAFSKIRKGLIHLFHNFSRQKLKYKIKDFKKHLKHIFSKNIK
jgi:membrane-associated protein